MNRANHRACGDSLSILNPLGFLSRKPPPLQAGENVTSRSIAEWLGTHANSAMHNRHITADVAEKHGLTIKRLEEDSELQDIVLTIHHAYMATFERSGAKKMIENSNGKSWIRIVS